MSLEDFVNMSLRELLGGQPVDPNVGVEVEEGGQMRLPSLSQQKAEVPQGTDIEVIVKESRDERNNRRSNKRSIKRSKPI